MDFADKLMQLRKKNGWSQEELAEKMNVSRQAVTKWESAQSVPDTEKIIKLSSLFSVSIDYLLKDEVESDDADETKAGIQMQKHISLKEAQEYLAQRQSASTTIALCVFLCIISPITLLALGAMSELNFITMSVNAAGGIGLSVLIVLVAIAVAGFIMSGSKNKWEFLESEPFQAEDAVQSLASERRDEYRQTYTKSTVAGTTLCILSVVPIFISAAVFDENELFAALSVCITIFIAAVGACILVKSGVVWASFNKLLQQGDYTEDKKRSSRIKEIVSSIYWTSVTAVYLLFSFYYNNWQKSWIIMAVAGVLFPAVTAVCSLLYKKK